VFAQWPDVEAASAGTNNYAETPLDSELVDWADIIFVMEKAHRAKIQRRFRLKLKSKRIVCLDIPDDYGFMQPELVALLERKVGPHL